MCLLKFFFFARRHSEKRGNEIRSQGCRKESSEIRYAAWEIVEWNAWVNGLKVMTIYHAWWVLPLSLPLFSQTFISFRYYLSFYFICTHTPLFVLFSFTSFVRPQMMRTFSNLFYYNIIKQNTFEWCLIPVWFFPLPGAIRFAMSASKK